MRGEPSDRSVANVMCLRADRRRLTLPANSGWSCSRSRQRAGTARETKPLAMDTDGIAAEVLYPSVGMTLAQSTDLEYQLACIRAYNDWLVSYCEGGEGRLVGLAMIPTVSVEAAVDEITRTAEAGLRGAMVPGR